VSAGGGMPPSKDDNWRTGFQDKPLKVVGQKLSVPLRFFPYVAYNLRGVGYLEDPIKLPLDEIKYRMEHEYFLKANITDHALIGIRILKRVYQEDEVFLNCIAAFMQEGSWVGFRVTGWPRMKKNTLVVRYLVEKGVIYYQREDSTQKVLVSPRVNGVTPHTMPFYNWRDGCTLPRAAQEAREARLEAQGIIPLLYDLQGETLPAFFI